MSNSKFKFEIKIEAQIQIRLNLMVEFDKRRLSKVNLGRNLPSFSPNMPKMKVFWQKTSFDHKCAQKGSIHPEKVWFVKFYYCRISSNLFLEVEFGGQIWTWWLNLTKVDNRIGYLVFEWIRLNSSELSQKPWPTVSSLRKLWYYNSFRTNTNVYWNFLVFVF